MLGTRALKSTGTNTIAAGFLTIQSSTRRVCSSMLSGLVGAACSMSAPSSLAALSAPTRTAFQNGLVTFFVNTTIFAAPARAPRRGKRAVRRQRQLRAS
jgi:hypothetical protein